MPCLLPVLYIWCLLMVALVDAQTDIHLIVDKLIEDPIHMKVVVDINSTASDLVRLLCSSEAMDAVDPVVISKCRDEIVPACQLLVPMNTTIFITLSPDTNHMTNGMNNLYTVSFHLCNEQQKKLHVLMTVLMDSLKLRRFFLAEILSSYCFKDTVEPLKQIITPDIQEDFNVQIYKGMNYIDQLELMVRDDEAFENFKHFAPEEEEIEALATPSLFPVQPPSLCSGSSSSSGSINSSNSSTSSKRGSSSGLDIAHVIFRVWYDSPTIGRMMTALTHMRNQSGHLFKLLTSLSAIDSSVGHPSMFEIGDASFQLNVSPVQLRYTLDAWMLHETFGTEMLSNSHILEIGGGYAGFFVTMAIMFRLGNYSIVDLEPAGRFQQKYVAAVFARNGNVIDYPIELMTIPSVSQTPVASDLLVSFFAISELNRQVVDKYLVLYISHATSGYLQLNYDDDDDGGNRESIPSEETVRNNLLYSPMQLFRKVYTVHPTAIMLPPPPYHSHHRIIWKPAPPPAPQVAEAPPPLSEALPPLAEIGKLQSSTAPITKADAVTDVAAAS